MDDSPIVFPESPVSPSILQALIPVAVLISLLSFSVYLFGEDASYGPNQIALCVGAAVAALIGWNNGQSWEEIEHSIVSGISVALKPCLILFSVGLLIGTWIMSGTVPTMIYYSLLILDPSIFYAASCLICALIALSIGSSWTVAGTVGIALIGASAGLGLSPEITAGAIISGGQGTAEATVTLQLTEEAGGTTRGTVSADLKLSGKAAAMGKGVIGNVTEQMMALFASNLQAMITAPAAAKTFETRAGCASANRDTWPITGVIAFIRSFNLGIRAEPMRIFKPVSRLLKV